MDGRDFGAPRSVHVPPPLLAGLAVEPHRLGAAGAAGRIPPSSGHLAAPHPPPLHSGKFLPSAINLHGHHSDAFPTGSNPFLAGYPCPSPLTADPAYRSSNPGGLPMAQLWASHAHEGYPLHGSLYASPYLSLGHLDPPSIPQNPLYDSHKESFFLPAAVSQAPLRPPSAPQSTLSSSTPPQKAPRDAGRERAYRGERDRDRERSREELRAHSVVDLTLDGKSEEDRRGRPGDKERERERDTERDGWSFRHHHHHHHHQKSSSQPSTGEPSSRPSPALPSFPPGGAISRLLGHETDRGSREGELCPRAHQHSNSNNSNSPAASHSERQRRNDSTPAGTRHFSYALPPSLQASITAPPLPHTLRECTREHRVTAPTYVPSVEVYDERVGPIQIASQARDKHGDKCRDRERENDKEPERESYRFPERGLIEHPRLSQPGDSSNHREEGSVICSNGSAGKRGQDPSHSSNQSRFSPEARDMSKHSSRLGFERAGADKNWNSISPLTSYATNHMAALAAQRGHALSSPHSQPSHTPISHSPHATNRPAANAHRHSPHATEHGQSRAGEEGSQRLYLDPSALYRPGASAGAERASAPSEVSAMQSLIKYSGNFAAEGPAASSRLAADTRGPFGGLASIGMVGDRDRERSVVGSSASGSLRVPPQLKREQDRPDSARSFGREIEGEVRHPPVGIAVAVARQRESTSSKQTGGSTDSQRPLLSTMAIKDEERGEERSRHHEDRMLAGRLERDDKMLRDPKELSDFTQLHPPLLSSSLTPSMMTTSLMTPNLMVTGGAGRWHPDPSTLTSHPWLPRPGAPPVWLSSSPYSLSSSPLHQTLPPGYPPPLPGAIPPPYQFVRDSQTGKLIVIPTEHLPHYGGDVLERGAAVWPGMYGTGTSLQHAAQLQLLSQQQMLRQQELLMIQQHTAQVLEMQRNAQFVEHLKASERRAETDDKADKPNAEAKLRPLSRSSPSPSPVLQPRRASPPPRSPTPSTSSLTPLPPSPATHLKSDELRQMASSHPPAPLPHAPSPCSASPPPSSPRLPKDESVDDGRVERGERRDGRKPAFQGIYSELSPDYPYQPIATPFGAPVPTYHVPAAHTKANPEAAARRHSHSLDLSPSFPSAHLRSRPLDADQLKPPKLTTKNESFPTEEPVAGKRRFDSTPQPLIPHRRSCSPVGTPRNRQDEAGPLKPRPIAPQVARPAPQRSPRADDVGLEAKEEQIKTEMRAYQCRDAYSSPLDVSEPEATAYEEPERTRYASSIAADLGGQESTQPGASFERESHRATTTPERHIPSHKESVGQIPASSESPSPAVVGSEDPMAGMLALLAASEMCRPHPLGQMASTLAENAAGPLEMVALEGMALLSQMAQREMENIGMEQDLAIEGLDYLLEASKQILLEAIEEQSHIDLPRTLHPNRKYSWRQRKEEPLYSKMSMDALDAAEVEYRIRLAELQKTYKEKQREMSKLQRRRDKHERLQQEDERRTLTRRGRGRPRKRKHLATPPKMDGRPAKVGRSLQYSEDSETGEGHRKRFLVSREDEETEMGTLGVKIKKKKKSKGWKDQDASGSHVPEGLKVKRGHVCEQEQLASDLDRALSLSRLDTAGAARKLASGSKGERPRGKSADGRPKERNIHSASQSGQKVAAKASEVVRKVKGQKKSAFFSPMRSELSSCSNNSDSEGHSSAKGSWPSLSGTRPHGNPARKRHAASSPCSVLSGAQSQKKKKKKKKHKHLSLLLEEAGLSSSDDSFDQGY